MNECKPLDSGGSLNVYRMEINLGDVPEAGANTRPLFGSM